MGIPLRVLFVEDNPDDVALVQRELRRCGYDLSDPERVETAPDLARALERPWDVIVSDFSMPVFTGPEALAVCRERGVATPFLIVSGTVGEEQAVSALKAGASDFISKQNLARLGPAVARELREAESREARRHAEAQLLRAQKMDAIGQLAGGVAHDLNNILGVILGHGELLLRQIGADDPGRRRVTSICDAADRAATLVRHLLAVSRRQIVQPTIVSLNQIVTETMKMLERVIGEHIEIVYGLAPDLWTIKADVSQVEQVFMNLVINARDAMPDGGTLWVETRNVSIDRSDGAVPCGDHILLQVSDTGHGMDEAVLSHIFEPFFTTKEPGKGTGLGLATVYGIVKQSEGHIEVESQPGQGTKFRIHLPRAERPLKTAVPAAPAAPLGGSETVLLLEDEVNLRLLIREILEEAGDRILSAESPEEALEIGSSYNGTIRLFLTDVVLPRVNGFEIAARVTAARPDLKVLFMSGYRDPAGRPPDVPPAPLLAKPFKGDALLTAVRNVLDGRA